MSDRRISRLCILSTLGSLALTLTGCGLSGGSTAGSGRPISVSPATTAGLGGKVYGGQQPITGAAVTLWAAGTTGAYGTGATSVATTTSNSFGAFSFNNTGVSPCTTGQFLYITAIGGNPGGGTNQYAALMAALPTPCGPGTASTFVQVNEVTTVASVTALQQFMSITPGGTPAWTIGAPAANVTGLANAFTQVGNLVNLATGASAATTATASISSVTYTTTITPDFTKINTLANILAACINTAGTSICNSLFTDTTPASSIAPTDTIQAAYYLASNAGGLNLPAHGASQGEPYYLCSTYITATPPFQPYGACTSSSTTYPTDWAIGVGWSTSNGSSVVGTVNTYSLAIDGNGNIWTADSCVASCGAPAANITEFNQAGQVQFAPVSNTTINAGPTKTDFGGVNTSYTSPNFTSTLTGPTAFSILAGRAFSLAIDTNNNAWFTGFYSAQPTTTGGIAGVITEVAPGGTSSGYLIPGATPGALAIDGNNNLYFGDAPASGRFYTSEVEFTGGTYATYDEGIDRQTTVIDDVWADNLGFVWGVASSGKCTTPNATIFRGKTTDLEGTLATDNVTNAGACPMWNGFPDGTGGAFFANGSLFDVAISAGSATLSAPVTVTEAAGTGTSNGGLDGGNGTFVDGLGNIWVANTAGGVSEFTFGNGVFTPLSPSGTNSVPVFGFGTSNLAATTPYLVTADASGNVWIGTTGSTLHYLVGIAGPTATPTAAMLKNNAIGIRPGGTATQKLVNLSPALTFSTLVPVSGSQTATLTNTGSLTVNISGMSIGGTNMSDFSVTNTTCGATLAVGANCSITVTFTSSAPGTFTGTLNVTSNASGSPASIALTGTASTGAALSLGAGTSTPPTVPSITFPTMVAGSVSASQGVVVTNSGSVPLTLTLGTTGAGANLFNQTTTCGASLAAGASCSLSFTFAPKVAGTYSAAVTLTDNAGNGMQTVALSGVATPFVITVNNTSPTSWVIDNGAITFNWNSTTGNLTSWVLDGHADQLVDTTTTSSGQPNGLYMDNTGTFGTGTPTAACTLTGGTVLGTPSTTCTIGTGSTPYLDWSHTIPSDSTNAYTFTEHWIVFPNDPGVHTYVDLNHQTSDIAGSVGQMQWLFRDSLSIFTNTYEVNSGLNYLGVQNIPQPSVADTSSTDPGRVVSNAVEDLHGFTDLPAGFTREFYTKYDYEGYEYLHQGHGVYGTASSGTTYGIWTVLPNLDTFSGGPTKQDLWFTNNIDMAEIYSDHNDEPINLNTTAGVALNRLFGPVYYHVNTVGTAYNQTGTTIATPADMYADALSAGASLSPLYDNIAPLAASGYVASTARGTVSLQINGVTGAPRTAWAVLSDPATNFQVSCNGYQYWADISANGTATIAGVVPGTYRLSVYALGQWGEMRQENIVVTANNTTAVPAVAFQPENFGGTTLPVFTIGTPDRSAHEFLHGSTANGNEDREFDGAWNYWADFSANLGAVVYYATAVGSTPATNDLTKWNYVHWGTSFDPGLFAGVFNSSDDTTDGYNYAIPSYVGMLPGATGTNGVTTGIPAWQVHFATPANFASEAFVVLSVAVACDEGSYVIALNGHSYTWSRTNESDCMVRSGLSGYTQWFAMQWPTSDLVQTAGGDNVISIGMSQPDGASDDALRLELTNTSADPATTGWHDYTFLNGTTTLNNDAVPNP
jgi:rhamnogalacturonan endolyase